MLLLLFYLALALVVSFLCSILESVLLATPAPYLMVEKDRGQAWAGRLLDMKTNVDRPLSAILSLNTVAHTIGAAGVGAQAVAVFGEEAFGIVSAVLTLLILVVTEIIPKTMGARYWRTFARPTAPTLSMLMTITYPLVQLSSVITRSIAAPPHGSSTSREEIAALAQQGAEEGVFSEKEHGILRNILRLKDVRVKDMMTPRVVVSTAPAELTLAAFGANKKDFPFSRIPVYTDQRENITGYVLRQDLFERLANDEHTLTLGDIQRDIISVPNSMDLFALWERLLASREHLAIVVDEYGGLDGVVTMEDIIETLLGLEIVDEKDAITDMQRYARERFRQASRLS